ncbi:MAG: sulfite exporter TauE/SafE family protein [Candidatus Sumerlaeota bacterium]|nr:sulfite exporter TauE/SafE family protein [Candidatus Sumerlaeota bacterium]
MSLAQLAVVGLAVVIMGVAKAGFGGGLGIVVTPLIAAAGVSPKLSIGIMLPILVACDLTAIWHYRRMWDRRNVAMLLPGVIAGIAIGSYLLGKFSDQWLGLSIGVLSIFFVALHLWKIFRRAEAEQFQPRWGHAHVFGAATGLTSTLAHVAGPITTMYLLPQRMDRMRFVGTTVILYTLLNGMKLIPFVELRLVNAETLRISLALLLFVPVGVFAGIWMNKRLNDLWFNRVVYVVLFLAGADLIQKNLTKIISG